MNLEKHNKKQTHKIKGVCRLLHHCVQDPATRGEMWARVFCAAIVLAVTFGTCNGFAPVVLLPAGQQQRGALGGRKEGVLTWKVRAAVGPKIRCPPLRAEQEVREENNKDWNKYIKEGMEIQTSTKREPEGPLEDDPTLPMIEDIIIGRPLFLSSSQHQRLSWKPNFMFLTLLTG